MLEENSASLDACETNAFKLSGTNAFNEPVVLSKLDMDCCTAREDFFFLVIPWLCINKGLFDLFWSGFEASRCRY